MNVGFSPCRCVLLRLVYINSKTAIKAAFLKLGETLSQLGESDSKPGELASRLGEFDSKLGEKDP